MRTERVWLMIVVIALVILIRFVVYPFLKKKWPFWKYFSWRLMKWKEIIRHYGAALRVIRDHPWFLVLPLTLTIVSMVIMALLMVKSFFRWSQIPGNSLYPELYRFDIVVNLIKSLSGSLSRIAIDWSGMINQYFFPFMILIYYFLFLTNVKNFRHSFFATRDRKDWITFIHWTAGPVYFLLIVAEISSLSQNPLANKLWMEIIIGLNILSMICALPFMAFFTALALKLIKRFFNKISADPDWQISRSCYFNLLLFLGISQFVLPQGFNLKKYFLKMWIIVFGAPELNPKIVQSVYSVIYSLLLLLFVFMTAEMVWKQKKLIPALKANVEFIFSNIAALMQIVAFVLPVLLITSFAGAYLQHILYISVPDLFSKLLFYLWRVIFPCLDVVAGLLLALAMSSLWFFKNQSVEKS